MTETPATPGLQLIAALCRNDRTVSYSSIPEGVFQEEEQRAFELFQTHLSRYGRAPDRSVFTEAGIVFPEVTQPASYYLERCLKRAKRNLSAAVRVELEREARKPDGQQDESVSILAEALNEMQGLDVTQSVRHDHDYYHDIVAEAQALMRRPESDDRNINLGHETLHRNTGGAQGGDIYVLAGRPNSGKSYTLIDMALQQIAQRKRALFFTMEMSPAQIAQRVLEMKLGLPRDVLQSGRLDYLQQRILRNYIAERMEEGSTPLLMPSDIKLNRSLGEIHAIVKDEEPDVVFIDGVYLLRPSFMGRNADRREKVASTFEELKQVALDVDRPFITTTQLNRQAQTNGGRSRELNLTHLGETDVIGQIATVVMGLSKEQRFGGDKRLMTCMKNRNGPLHKYLVNFGFNPHNFTFDREVTDEEFEQAAPAVDADAYA